MFYFALHKKGGTRIENQESNKVNNYYVSYEIVSSKAVREFRIYCSGPVIALNAFHRAMQRERELDGQRKVIRPRLKPDQYKILRLFLRYNDGTGLQSGRTVESNFDLPDTGNPDLNYSPKKKKKTARVQPQEFDFTRTQGDFFHSSTSN